MEAHIQSGNTNRKRLIRMNLYGRSKWKNGFTSISDGLSLLLFYHSFTDFFCHFQNTWQSSWSWNLVSANVNSSCGLCLLFSCKSIYLSLASNRMKSIGVRFVFIISRSASHLISQHHPALKSKPDILSTVVKLDLKTHLESEKRSLFISRLILISGVSGFGFYQVTS